MWKLFKSNTLYNEIHCNHIAYQNSMINQIQVLWVFSKNLWEIHIKKSPSFQITSTMVKIRKEVLIRNKLNLEVFKNTKIKIWKIKMN